MTPGQVVQRYLDALVAGETDVIRDCFADDARWVVHGSIPLSGTYAGPEGIVDGLLGQVGTLFAGPPSFTMSPLLVSGESVVLEWRVRATGASGAPYDGRYCGVFVVRGERIAEVREYADTEQMARVLYS